MKLHKHPAYDFKECEGNFCFLQDATIDRLEVYSKRHADEIPQTSDFCEFYTLKTCVTKHGFYAVLGLAVEVDWFGMHGIEEREREEQIASWL